jgi:hypothetical protein
MRRHLAGFYLSNILLLGFSTAWLVLIFIPLLIASDHAMGLWYEDNVVVLGLETAICLFGIAWSASRIVIYMRHHIRKYRKWRMVREHYVKT